jgi:hypothetical protein
MKITNYKIQITNKFQITMSKITNRRTVISHWSFVIGELGEKVTSIKRRLKASIPLMHTNSNELDNIQYIAAFSAGSIQLKKPSVGPKGLIGPPCHGAPGRRRQIGEIL